MINTELHNGDCLEYMKKIPTSSIDLIITDPPYNLGKFMEEKAYLELKICHIRLTLT